MHPRDIECFYIDEKYLFPYQIELNVEEEPSIFDIFSFGESEKHSEKIDIKFPNIDLDQHFQKQNSKGSLSYANFYMKTRNILSSKIKEEKWDRQSWVPELEELDSSTFECIINTNSPLEFQAIVNPVTANS